MSRIKDSAIRLLKSKRFQGAASAGLLTFAVIIYFFGTTLKNINSTLFASDGDGLKCYYCVKYHVAHDDSFMRFDGMNYPFGEYVVYTDGMPPVANTLKLIKPIIDLSDYTVAIINLIMLLSAVLGAIYLYLIFERLKVNQLLSICFAVGIVMLSPQWVRVMGHFSLSLHFFIPMIIYHLLVFREKKSWWHVSYIALGSFLMMFMHPYYYPMSAVIVVSFFAVFGAFNKFNWKLVKCYIVQFLVALVSPFLLFNLLIKIFDTGINRTKLPWGFWEFQSNTSGIFFPFGKPYEDWARSIADPLDVSWEGVAYVGLFAMLFFVVGTGYLCYRLVKEKSIGILASTRGKVVFFMFLVFLFGMMISFAFPFNLGYEDWLNHLGAIKQLRGIGRYAWLCYFSLNIIGLLVLDSLIRKAKPILAIGVALPALAILLVDGYYLVKDIPDRINNIGESWNELPANHWSKEVDMNEYQCLVPFPYFHVGSENLGMSTPEEFKGDIFTTSAAYGIPTTGVNMSRTPIEQTNQLIEMHQHPYRVPEVLDQFDSDKPMLCVVKLPEGNSYLHSLLKNEEPLFSSDHIVLVSITPEEWKENVISFNTQQFNNNKKQYTAYPEDELFAPDSSFFFASSEPVQFKINDYKTTVELPSDSFFEDEEELNLSYSFWLNDIDVDLYVRGALEIAFVSDEGTYAEYFGLHGQCVQIDGNKGLFEFNFKAKRGVMIKCTLMNSEIVEPLDAVLSNQLLRRTNSTIVKLNATSVELNNRVYQK